MQEPFLGFLKSPFDKVWRDGAFIDIEEGDVIVGNLMKKDDELHEIGVSLPAEVAFDFEHQPTDTLGFIGGFVGEDLFGKRKHAATGFTGADCSQDGDARVETTLGNYEPARSLRRPALARVVNLADYDEQLLTMPGIGVRRKLCRSDASVRLESKDVETGKQN